MRISDWSSDVCSSDLLPLECADRGAEQRDFQRDRGAIDRQPRGEIVAAVEDQARPRQQRLGIGAVQPPGNRSEEHTSELQSLMRISYAVFCLKKKKQKVLAYKIVK